MGIYLNPDNEKFLSAVQNGRYIDKTMFVAEKIAMNFAVTKEDVITMMGGRRVLYSEPRDTRRVAYFLWA